MEASEPFKAADPCTLDHGSKMKISAEKLYETKEEAHAAYSLSAVEAHGEFARLR